MLGVVMQKMPDEPKDMRYSGDSIVSSPVTSLMSSLNRHSRVSVRGKKRRASSRTVNSRETNESISIDSDYNDSSGSFSTTNWVEVMFLKTEQVNNDVFNIQGCREDTMGVTIVPEWTPPSPTNMKGHLETSSPKRLLPTSFIKYIQSESQDDYYTDSSDDITDDVSDTLDNVEKKSTVKDFPEKSILSLLLTPQSPLATTNIRSLLTPDKLCTIPLFARKHIIQYLPQCDRDSILLNDHKATESTFNNEYINAALREWQENIALGITYNNKHTKTDYNPSWRDNTVETNSIRNNLPSSIDYNNTSQFNNILSDNQQYIYDCLFCQATPPSQPIPQATPIPKATPILVPRLTSKNSSLSIHLPRQHYNAAHYTRNQIHIEHSYCKPHPSNRPRLPITLKTQCTCLNMPLRMCTLCHKFYHGGCSKGNNICQDCVKRKTLDKL